MKPGRIYCAVLLCLMFLQTHAQRTDSLSGHAGSTGQQKDYNPKEEVEINGKRFRVYNNWMNIGTGIGLNTALPFTESIIDVNAHFHFGKQYIQLGTFLSGDRFLSFNNYNIHACYGKRFQSIQHNLFFCAGPSYSWGFPFSQGIYQQTIYTRVGGYAEAQYIYKLAYDLGIGASLFGDFNERQIVYGLRLELYFSGAYRGEGKKKAPWAK